MRVMAPAAHNRAALITFAAILVCWLLPRMAKTGKASTWVMLKAVFLGMAFLGWVVSRLPKLRMLLGGGDRGLPWVRAADEMQVAEPTAGPRGTKPSGKSRRYLSMIDDDETDDQYSSKRDHLPPVSVSEEQPTHNLRAQLTIAGFEKAMKPVRQELCGKQQSRSMVAESPGQPLVGDALQPIIEDPDGPATQLSSRPPVSVRSSARLSTRSDSSQRIIDDLQEQIRKLQEENFKQPRTPSSARSDSSQRIINDLQDQIRRLQEENSKQPRTPSSARSESSQRIIGELQEQIRQLQSEKTKQPATPSSARSNSSQHMIEELQQKLRHLQEEGDAQTSNLSSARSESAQRVIDSLHEQLRCLREETATGDQNPSTCRSTRSDSSQARIEELRAQLQSLKRDDSQTLGSDASQQAIAEVGAALQRPSAEEALMPLDDVVETPRSVVSNSTLRSVRSDTSQRIIDAMDSELQHVKKEKEVLESKLELQSEASMRLQAEAEKQRAQLRNQELQLHSQQLTNEEQSRRLADQDNKIEELTKMFRAFSQHPPQHAQAN